MVKPMSHTSNKDIFDYNFHSVNNNPTTSRLNLMLSQDGAASDQKNTYANNYNHLKQAYKYSFQYLQFEL